MVGDCSQSVHSFCGDHAVGVLVNVQHVLRCAERPFGQEGVLVDIAFRLPLYVIWLIWEIIKANVDVARRILDPRLPISPRMVRVKADQRHELSRVIYANSITLTPGTVSVDTEGDMILVHALTKPAADDVEAGKMGRQVKRLEGSE